MKEWLRVTEGFRFKSLFRRLKARKFESPETRFEGGHGKSRIVDWQ